MAGAAASSVDRKIRVLLVDDEAIHRAVARAVLKAVGSVELDEAENGAEAVGRVRERGAGAGGAYDLILTDRQMPVMDGHEATRQIRALGVTKPIVGLSSDCLAADVDAFIKASADDFTPKRWLAAIAPRDAAGDNKEEQWARGKAGEDRVHVVVSEEHGWTFVGIYDGFNGPDATDYLVAHLYAAVCRELSKISTMDDQDEEVLDALARALQATEAGYLADAEARAAECPELAMMGSCVLVVLVRGAHVYGMNVGDSRAVLAVGDLVYFPHIIQ